MFPLSRHWWCQFARLSALGGLQPSCDNQAGAPDSSAEDGVGQCIPADAVPGEECIDEVVGMVLDENDRPETNLDITVCGARCFRGVTNAQGRFSIPINMPLSLKDYSVQPHGTQEASTFYFPLTAASGQATIDLGTLRTVELPGKGDLLVTKLELDGAAPPAQSVTSGDFALQFQQGDLVRISVADALSGDAGRMFRARELDPEETDWFGSFTPDARVFALGPFEAEISHDDNSLPQVGLRVSNDRNWEAGSDVSVLALGSYLDPKWLTPSVFEEIGVAQVSEDGAEIVLLPEDVHAGFQFITWIALELR